MIGELLLDDVGRVRTQHDQFAMSHVDDTHDAEGDRQAYGSEQQHGTQR